MVLTLTLLTNTLAKTSPLIKISVFPVVEGRSVKTKTVSVPEKIRFVARQDHRMLHYKHLGN